MFPEFPWINVWIAMQLTPPFEPHTLLTAIVVVLDPHAVVMGVVPGGHTCLAGHVLMVL
jgi:hypothetical protein